MGILRTWNHTWNHAPIPQELWAISPFTLKSQCMYLWNLVAITSISMLFHKLPSQEHKVKMYKVTQGHTGGSRRTQTSTQPFSHTCWGHDAHEKSVRKSENTFSKETNPINQMQLSYWNPLFKGVPTPSGVWEQGKFPCVRLLNTKLNFSVLRALHWFALC